ncbi:unnamed protein product [Ceutorhynchus assimilis]|uniref:non-specific serine/threonine protein kinase n=1 Tax=Ceutorhynchus assimilis TaxID=467358 RepID=A0A9N9MZC9_9CUCU|nr:unnamed protein product [Ceutorhynchus assimilis]
MSSSKPQMYIYHLPYEERRKLCFILDQNNKWEELALKHMLYDEMAIANVRKEVVRGNSPSSELLTLWGHQNHTVFELFILLYRMDVHEGLSILRPFVDDKYHRLIKITNIENGIKRVQIHDSKVPTSNFNRNTDKSIPKPGPVFSNENNETKINNNLQAQATEKPLNIQVNANNDNVPNFKRQQDSTQMLTACVASSAGLIPQIPYEELELATDNWNSNRILGQGGFGTVFRGTWKCTQVAIKRLKTKENTKKEFAEQIRQSITELHCLNAYRHDNILPIYGYSISSSSGITAHPCLVYQYMPGGSLDSRIRTRDETRVMSWPARLNIAIGTARGLQFLHTTLHGNKPLIHGDIKSANILLDLLDQPKIGDFGLAREGPENNLTHILVSRVQGTAPYLPIEFLRSNQFSTKIDTYSFGVVLFELATACPPASATCNKRLLKDYVVDYPVENIIQLKDPRAEGGESIFYQLVRIGKECVQHRSKRPEMVDVLLMLEKVMLL